MLQTVRDNVKVELTEEEVIIRLPRYEVPKLSSSGKSYNVAGTSGNVLCNELVVEIKDDMGASVAQRPLIVVATAYIKK